LLQAILDGEEKEMVAMFTLRRRDLSALLGPASSQKLFGSERGACTGAIARTRGTVQQANKGTHFLG
jgi:transcriptional regulator of acetoin/glycerol metabolism